MSTGLKKELRKHSGTKWGVGGKRDSQANTELFIGKSAKIVRSEPPDKRFYKRLVNATDNRIYRGNEN